MATPSEYDFYKLGGMQVDVNPYQQQDQDFNLLLNFYSHKYWSKKVRFGYTQFLNNPDSSPVRNLNFYQLPGNAGIVRVSGGKSYLNTTFNGSWTQIPTMTFTQDIQAGSCQISGIADYLVLSTAKDGMYTFDGTNVIKRNGSYTPLASYLASFQSRVFGDINQLSIAESWVGFDQNIYPTAIITGGGGSGASISLTQVGGVITTATIVSGGSSYSSVPTVTVYEPAGSSGTGAVLSVTLVNSQVATVTIVNGGSGYDDPFSYNTSSANPAEGGVNPIDSGNNGAIVGFNVVQNCLMIYKQRGVYRYDGTNFLQMNFGNSVIPYTICSSDYSKNNYWLSYNSIYMTDGSSVVPASFGVNTIIQDTLTNYGIQNPLSYCFDYFTFFFIGNIWYQPSKTVPPIKITNGILVKDERFNEWYIWSVGHTITAFGSYSDANNVRHLITGDNQGNTYVWGEQYSMDGTKPISYNLRTSYKDHGSPTGTKTPQPQVSISADPSAQAQVAIARNFSDKYLPIGTAKGHFGQFNSSGNTPSYKNLSIEVSGDTSGGDRPEVYGFTIPVDIEERYSDNRTGRQERR